MSQQQSIAAMLSGGNPRSLGRTDEVVASVLSDESTLGELYSCMLADNDIVRMRASDAFEKVSSKQPQWIQPYIPQLLTEIASIEQASVQWHLAQILGEVELTPEQRKDACRILKRNLTEKKDWIVLNFSMKSLARLSKGESGLQTELLKHLKELQSDPHKSVVAHASKLIRAIEASLNN